MESIGERADDVRWKLIALRSSREHSPSSLFCEKRDRSRASPLWNLSPLDLSVLVSVWVVVVVVVVVVIIAVGSFRGLVAKRFAI